MTWKLLPSDTQRVWCPVQPTSTLSMLQCPGLSKQELLIGGSAPENCLI